MKKFKINDKEFEFVGTFNNGVAPAQKDNLWGFIDLEGETVIPFIYEWADEFYKGLAVVKVKSKREKYGIINEKGEFVVSPIFDDACSVPMLGGLRVRKNGKNGTISPTTFEVKWD